MADDLKYLAGRAAGLLEAAAKVDARRFDWTRFKPELPDQVRPAWLDVLSAQIHAAASTSMPEGYRLVPVEPTEAMLDCIAGTSFKNLSPSKQAAEIAAYSAMLSASEAT